VRLVLLGDPVAHSRSPAIFRAALAAAGIAGTYSACRADAAAVRAACSEMREGRLDGANVTMPHKRVAAAAADTRAPSVVSTGAANTLVARSGSVEAHNTDVDGVAAAWGGAGFPDAAPVLILGAGGAAAAAVVALAEREPLVAARRPEGVRALSATTGLPVRAHEWGAPLPGAVVVNATPLGMAGEGLPAGVVEGAAGLLDMVYGDVPTPAILIARAARIPAVDGLGMLVAQAARSFELWTGRPAPRGIMAAAAGH
jgi:shikimate dehydrogenase